MDISPERITARVLTGVRSRASSVIEDARKGGYGTIAVGRKGLSEVTDFSMGRVTNKLIQLAKDEILIIVNERSADPLRSSNSQHNQAVARPVSR